MRNENKLIANESRFPAPAYSSAGKRFVAEGPGESWKMLRNAVALSLCLLLYVGCAASPAVRDRLIAERAQARWDALLSSDYARAYGYMSPGYRSAHSAADFEIDFRSRRVQYTSADYLGHDCIDASCTVKIKVGYKVVRPVAGLSEWKSTDVIEERWINTDGEWWYLPES
jgi:hypothetical protein